MISFEELKADIAKLRDEAKVQVHLGAMEARKEWDELETKWAQFVSQARLHESGLGQIAGRRLVLTGGASQIPGLRELGQKYLEKQVRLGRPVRMPGLAEAVSGAAFSTTAGLLHYVTERTDEMPAEIMATVEPGTLWQRVQVWLRENW